MKNKDLGKFLNDLRETLEKSLEEKRGRKRHRKKAAKRRRKMINCTRIAKRKYDAWIPLHMLPALLFSAVVVKFGKV